VIALDCVRTTTYLGRCSHIPTLAHAGRLASIGIMTTYRIVPNRGTYKVEAVEPDGQHTLLGTWRTEEAAVSHLKKLQGEAQSTDYRPAPGEVGWQPRQNTSGR